MATLDMSPLYRSTIGFERLPTLLADAVQQTEVGYPPYNIEKLSEDDYHIVIAVAGFENDEIDIVAEQGRLTVRGSKSEPGNGATYLHHGIANRSFERKFDLAEYVEVTGASLANGLLEITLKRELPDSMKPRRIEIGSGDGRSRAPRRLEKVAA